MIKQISIYPKIKNSEINKTQVQFFIDYLDKKYPEWSEFTITNKTNLRLLVCNSKVEILQNTLNIGKLIDCLNKLHTVWERFTINTKDFTIIPPSKLKVGMLFRFAQEEKNLYNLVTETTRFEATCLEEGRSKPWYLNFEKQKTSKLKIVIQDIENYSLVEEYLGKLN
jgi:hypothetical protein